MIDRLRKKAITDGPLTDGRGGYIALTLLFAAVVAAPFLSVSQLTIMTLIFIFGILAFSAIIPIGYAGQLIICQGAFFGVGAYTFVRLSTFGVPSWVALVLACGLTGVVAYVLGRPATKTGGIYMGIMTLAFNEAFIISLIVFSEYTGGSQGLSSPMLYFPSILTDLFSRFLLYYYVSLVAFVLVLYLASELLSSNVGKAFLAVKEDANVAASIGIDARRYRLLSFVLSGLVCGFAGGIYAPASGYISPSSFDLHTTIDIILAGVLGGLLYPIGSILGASIVVSIPEVLRVLPPELRLAVYGVVLIFVLVYIPQGLGGYLKSYL